MAEERAPIYAGRSILNPRFLRRLSVEADDHPNPGSRHRLLAEDDQGTIWVLMDWTPDYREINRLQHLYARHWGGSDV